ncbi:UDP-glycosyltransferase 13 [Ziziphus jujuba]|uniref:UDP-glycosyltransferase 13 n=1 Tax=Ziziphus jujuba TaxID=326968 RepID=A0A6P3ZM59_ZIZJJ|nr:UDP-glycosyltransferase 13 [Ziziphus jujuba]
MLNRNENSPHIALFPSAGMGHLTPFLRLASMLLSHKDCHLTLITGHPTVSDTESSYISYFLSQNPEVNHIQLQIIPFHGSNPTTDDPFFLQFEATRRSAHLLHPLLSSTSPPLSALFSDFVVASTVSPIAADLGIPNYIVATTSAKFFCLMAYLPTLLSNVAELSRIPEVKIPGLTPLQISSIPPPFKDPDHLFTAQLATNALALSAAKGILINTFDGFESETLAAANDGRVLTHLPSFLPTGPLEPYELNKEQMQHCLSWLDRKPAESVVYVSFGSRTAMSNDQIRELSKGLERSGYHFLWVLKTSKVDRDDKEELKDLLGYSFLERTEKSGMVVKGWVNQQEILDHPAIGGFINHCGWNSVMEAARRGIPMLAWPQHGDQMVNAEIVKDAGLGIWERKWGWGVEALLDGEEIAERIGELMGNEKLKSNARKVGEEARKASGVDGSSEKVLMGVIEFLKQQKN